MSSSTQKFVIVGIHAGKTLNINGHEFVDGEFSFSGGLEQIATLGRIFEYYSVYPADKAELIALKAQLAAQQQPVQSVPASDIAKIGGDNEKPQDPVVPKPDLAEAIGLLDPANDAHWTSNNLPALEALAQVMGKDKVSRGDVEAIAAGYTRAKAASTRQ